MVALFGNCFLNFFGTRTPRKVLIFKENSLEKNKSLELCFLKFLTQSRHICSGEWS